MPKRDASEWYALLHGSTATEDDWADFRIWALDPDNSAEYRLIEQMMGAVDQYSEADLAQAEGQGIPRAVATFGDRIQALLAQIPTPARAAFAGITASLAIAIVFMAVRVDAPVFDQYQTEIGEQLAVELVDGSIVTLNTNSAIEVRYSRNERRIDLVRGQAAFDVAHEPDRKLSVHSSHGTITALGTSFDVYQRLDGLVVTLLDGAVVVERPCIESCSEYSASHEQSERSTRIDLAPGQQAFLSNDESTIRVADVDAKKQLSWTAGKIHIVDMELRDAVSEMNRYLVNEIALNDDELATHRVSGVFNADEPEVFVATMEMLLPVIAVDRGDSILIQSADSAAEQ